MNISQYDKCMQNYTYKNLIDGDCYEQCPAVRHYIRQQLKSTQHFFHIHTGSTKGPDILKNRHGHKKQGG